jgi:hypothetical protein
MNTKNQNILRDDQKNFKINRGLRLPHAYLALFFRDHIPLAVVFICKNRELDLPIGSI